jgi:hypothetical protein
MKAYHDGTALWRSPSALARELGYSQQTITEWCRTGFIFLMGYRTRRTPKGFWLIADTNPKDLNPTS